MDGLNSIPNTSSLDRGSENILTVSERAEG